MFTWRPLGIDLMLLSLRWTTCYFDENYYHCSCRDDVVKSTYPENHFDGRHYRHNCHHHHHWTRPDIWNSPKTKIPNITVLGIVVTAGTTTNKAGARITSLAALWIVWLPWLPYSTYQYLDFQLLLCSMTKLEAHDREICERLDQPKLICNTEMMMMMILYMQWFCQIDLSLSFCRYAALSQLSTTVTWSATQVLPLESQTTALIVDTIFFFATSSKSSALSTSTVSHSSTSDEKCCHYDQYCCYHD